MSKNSYRIRKCRALKKACLEHEDSGFIVERKVSDHTGSLAVLKVNNVDVQCENDNSDLLIVDQNVNNLTDNNYTSGNDSMIQNGESSFNSSASISFMNKSDPQTEFEQQTRHWALNNLNTWRLSVVSELLLILRRNGHETLPKTAQTLLNTQHHRTLNLMPSCKGGHGEFAYLGIHYALKNIIKPNVFLANTISVLAHIDGAQIYNNSQVQIWPIVLKITHQDYITKPFAVAIYCGDAKPMSAEDFMSDFVAEVKYLTLNGVDISEYYAGPNCG